MSEILQLMFPGCSSQSVDVDGIRSEKPFSSASVHFLTSFAVAIIIGIGAALAAHFLSHSAIEWTAIAGGGAALLSGIITYITLRCVFGKITHDAQTTSIGSVSASSGERLEIHESKKKTSNGGSLLPKWLTKLLPQDLARISFEVGEAIDFKSIRDKMTSPIAFLEGKTSAIVLDLLVKHTDLDPNYIPPLVSMTYDVSSSSNFHMLIVVANNGNNGQWRLIPEIMDIQHRTVTYSTRFIFPDDRGNIIHFFDSAANPKIDVDPEREPENNKLQWLLSCLLTKQTAKKPEFKLGLFMTSEKVGTWEISISPVV